MPAFGDRVSEEEIGRLVGYIRWLRREAEPRSGR
jgi:mono/diheme cytochrome c family protein